MCLTCFWVFSESFLFDCIIAVVVHIGLFLVIVAPSDGVALHYFLDQVLSSL